jgi:hypothetical protein
LSGREDIYREREMKKERRERISYSPHSDAPPRQYVLTDILEGKDWKASGSFSSSSFSLSLSFSSYIAM